MKFLPHSFRNHIVVSEAIYVIDVRKPIFTGLLTVSFVDFKQPAAEFRK